MTTLTYSGTLVTATCWCGLHHAIPSELMQIAQDEGEAPRLSGRGSVMTNYLILGSNGDKTWRELAKVEASSTEQAVRKAADGFTEVGLFLAVPERSAKPLRVERSEVVQVRVKPGREA